MRLPMLTGKIILALGLAICLPSMAFAMTPGQVYERVKDSVVVVKAYDRQGKLTGLGSGVMLPSGDIVTNYHVVESGARYTVGRGEQASPAKVKDFDEESDLCMLTAPGLAAAPARLGKAASLKVGDPVYAVGAPQGLELSLSEGIVSQLRGGLPPIIQTTVAISPGSSGGGLFNAKGELVGITTFYLKGGQSLNFALPVEWIAQVASHPAPVKKTESWAERAEALNYVQNWPGLLAWSRRWTQAEPDNARAWYYLGWAYGELGRYREAIEAYREALRLKPDDANVWYFLGHVYFMSDRYSDAIQAFREALRLKPDDAAWFDLGLAYARSGNRSAALEAVKELRRYDPKKAEWLFKEIIEEGGDTGKRLY